VWVIVFVLLLTVVLDRLLLRPVLRVLGEREQAIRSARELAESAAARARAATAEFEERTGAARAEVYRQMDELRRVALERRQEMLSATRAEAERQITEATERIKAETEAARAQLERDAEALGAVVAERVLGRKAS
jgi:F-type H+-transporting ATPase subunit b